MSKRFRIGVSDGTIPGKYSSSESLGKIRAGGASNLDADVIDTVMSFCIEPKWTGFKSHWQNGIAERFVRSCRNGAYGGISLGHRTSRVSLPI